MLHSHPKGIFLTMQLRHPQRMILMVCSEWVILLLQICLRAIQLGLTIPDVRVMKTVV